MGPGGIDEWAWVSAVRKVERQKIASQQMAALLVHYGDKHGLEDTAKAAVLAADTLLAELDRATAGKEG